jgi:hypothetical protein
MIFNMIQFLIFAVVRARASEGYIASIPPYNCN